MTPLRARPLALAAFAAAARAAPAAWCSGERLSWLICNASAPDGARVDDLVARFSAAGAYGLFSSIPGDGGVGLQLGYYDSESYHGLEGVGASRVSGAGASRNSNAAAAAASAAGGTAGASGAAASSDGWPPYNLNTVEQMTLANSFNRSLWRATAAALGREARAFYNLGGANGQTFWAPMANIVRDPRWGRNLQSAGEDPFVAGEFVAAWVRAFERAPEAPYGRLQASAMCKHFVAGELESWNGSSRYHFDAVVPQQDLVDSYLPPFQMCVEEGQVSGVMCAYNGVNGVPSCGNAWLLTTLLRESWGFEGYVTADCDADLCALDPVFAAWNHNDTLGVVAALLRNGQDLDCGWVMTDNLPFAVGNGTVSMDEVLMPLRRLMQVQLRLGLFDAGGGPLDKIGAESICTAAAVEVARDGARQGAVLLKNANGALPLRPAASYASVLVAGPTYNVSELMPRPCNGSTAGVADAVRQHAPGAVIAPGLPAPCSSDTSGFANATAAAAAADLVVLSLGLMHNDCGEGEMNDRSSIDLPAAQKQLAAAVAAAAAARGATVLALVLGGGAIDISSLLANENISAVLWCGQPHVSVVGVGDLLFGRSPDGQRPAAPAGRLAQTFYGAAFVDEVSMFDFAMRPGASAFFPYTNPGRTHRFYAGLNVVLPFGFGLSYTSWAYTPLPDPTPPAARAAALARVRAAAEAQAATGVVGHVPAGLKEVAVSFLVNVTNTGAVDSDDVVLGFLVPPGAGADGIPLQELFAFERVFVRAGQTVTVYLGAQGVRFTQADKGGVRRFLAGEYGVRLGVKEAAAHRMGFAEQSVLVA